MAYCGNCGSSIPMFQITKLRVQFVMSKLVISGYCPDCEYLMVYRWTPANDWQLNYVKLVQDISNYEVGLAHLWLQGQI